MSRKIKSTLGVMIFLLIACGAMMILSNYMDPVVRNKILSVSGEAFSLIVGSIIGILISYQENKDEN